MTDPLAGCLLPARRAGMREAVGLGAGFDDRAVRESVHDGPVSLVRLLRRPGRGRLLPPALPPNQRPQGHGLLTPSPRLQPSGETIAPQTIAPHTLASHGPLSRRPGTQRPGIAHRSEPSHLACSRRGLSLWPLLWRPDPVRTPAVSEADERHHRQDQRGFVGGETQGPRGAARADVWKTACSNGSIAARSRWTIRAGGRSDVAGNTADCTLMGRWPWPRRPWRSGCAR